MEEELQKLRGRTEMIAVVDIFFNYDMNMLDIKNMVFMIKETTTLFFNFLNLFFQLYTKPLDKAYTRPNGYVNVVRRYCEVKS